ncbi:35466_t:CDS:2, partial [Racocetra persica]
LLNQENQLEIEEHSTYPSSTKIIYKERFKNQTQRSFIYNIQKESIYPSNNKLVTTMKQKNFKENTEESQFLKNKRPFQEYKIPDKYAPQFLIKYGLNFENIISSMKSATQAALLYERTINPSSKSTISGPLVFGLQLKTVQKIRESYNKSRQVKPANQCTEMTLEN